jgi:hypothetical protein
MGGCTASGASLPQYETQVPSKNIDINIEQKKYINFCSDSSIDNFNIEIIKDEENLFLCKVTHKIDNKYIYYSTEKKNNEIRLSGYSEYQDNNDTNKPSISLFTNYINETALFNKNKNTENKKLESPYINDSPPIFTKVFMNLPRDYNFNNEQVLWEGNLIDSQLKFTNTIFEPREIKVDLKINKTKNVLSQNIKTFGISPIIVDKTKNKIYNLNTLPDTVFTTISIINSTKVYASVAGPCIIGGYSSLIQFSTDNAVKPDSFCSNGGSVIDPFCE